MRRRLLFVAVAAFGSLLLPHGPLADDAQAVGVLAEPASQATETTPNTSAPSIAHR